MQEAEQKKVVAGYQETETFECKMCNNGKSLRVEMEHVSWMTDVRTEKTAFDVSVLLIVSLEVFFFVINAVKQQKEFQNRTNSTVKIAHERATNR